MGVCKAGENTKRLLHFQLQGNTLFPVDFFPLCFPGLALTQDGDDDQLQMASGWQRLCASDSQQAVCDRRNLLPRHFGNTATNFTWFIYFFSSCFTSGDSWGFVSSIWDGQGLFPRRLPEEKVVVSRQWIPPSLSWVWEQLVYSKKTAGTAVRQQLIPCTGEQLSPNKSILIWN